MRGFACDIDLVDGVWRMTHGGARQANKVDTVPLGLFGAGSAPVVWAYPGPTIASPPIHQSAYFVGGKGFALGAGGGLLDSITTEDIVIELIISAAASAGYVFGNRYAAGAGLSVTVDGAGLVTCIVDDGVATRTLAAITPLVAGVSTHVVIAVDRSEANPAHSGIIYLDGVQDNTAQMDGGDISNANYTAVGIRGDAGATYNGYVGYFAVHALDAWLPGGVDNLTVIDGLAAELYNRFADPTLDWIDQAGNQVLSKESFESQWAVAAGGNENSVLEFDETDLELGRIGDGRREDFERAWTAPEERGLIVAVALEGWPIGLKVIGGTSGAFGYVLIGVPSGTDVELRDIERPNGIDWTVGEALAILTPSEVEATSGRADGVTSRFSKSGGAVYRAYPGSVRFEVEAFDGTTMFVADDGNGNLLGDVASSGDNEVRYYPNAMSYDVTFAKPPKAGGYIFAHIEHKEAAPQLLTYTKTSSGLAGNTDAISEFYPTDLALSAAETFESNSKSPTSYLKIFVAAGLIFSLGNEIRGSISGIYGRVTERAAAYIVIRAFNVVPEYSPTDPVVGETISAVHDSSVSTVVNGSGFLHVAQASPWNDSAVMDGSFESGAATANLGSFDTGAEDYEDFEEGWYNNEGSKSAYNDVSGSATFDLGPFADAPPEDFEDFDDWTTTLSL